MTRAEATQKAPYNRLLFFHLHKLHNLDSDSACGCSILPRHIHRRPSEYNATRSVRLYIPSLLALPASPPSAVLSYAPTRIPLSSATARQLTSTIPMIFLSVPTLPYPAPGNPSELTGGKYKFIRSDARTCSEALACKFIYFGNF
ncbi:hypothetical protein K438DRAFT_1994034 [Mycena galopus ATCC 62051]|nr:hypothetical protein K438DRAFT_1994034 [Mycena galopus ATCC 62051]